MTTELVKIQDVDVYCPIQNGEVFVPVKPICEVLGIAHQAQQEVIKKHPIISSVVMLSMTTGSDGKQYEMTCIPLRYAFGWLFGIDARSVKPEAYENVIRYQTSAYEALYERFYLEPVLQKQKLLAVLEKEAAIKMAEVEKRELSLKIRSMKAELDEIKAANPTQYSLTFPEN